MSAFTCLTSTPIELSHPGIAVATVRAGGVAILDREFCREEQLRKARENLLELMRLVGNKRVIGLRLKLQQIDSSTELLRAISSQPHWLILCQWEPQSLATAIASLPEAEYRQLILEITDIRQLEALESQFTSFLNGFIAKGQESGGWGGEDQAFILAQKLLKSQNLPVYVQGGIGIHNAAACRVAGAAGVVLDDQLWLMKESPLPVQWRNHLINLGGQEAIAVGERLGKPVRVLSRPGFEAINQLQKLAEKLEIEQQNAQSWQQEADQFIGWGEPGSKAYPIGQSVGLATRLSHRYRTTGRLIQALLQASQAQILSSKQLLPLQAGAPLAQAHGTQYPIVQGPMTRVSDTAEFAAAVAENGGLPLLALALMKQPQVKELLQQAQDKLGNRSWGVGILGFVPQALREQQLAVIEEIKPPFALIAGGRPDQAAQLEQKGIKTYIHVPTPSLLEMFLEQGATKFIFEGRECGGHVGPLSSFVLWESVISTLLAKVTPEKAQQIQILFAGGIHDALSAVMVSVMAAPLAQRGIKFGVLMGSAYLFTQEAVSCGAIIEGFQEQALQCQRTINLETGPGHASRCAVTPFVEEFYATRRRMLAAGNSATEIKHTLEDLTLGRLRVASKGLQRQDSQISPVTPQQQRRDGMYMIGQVATMRDRICTIEQLHQDVSQGSTRFISHQSSVISHQSLDSKLSDIAIVGIGTLLPKAQAPETFWSNILNQVNAISEIPPQRWDWRLYYDSQRQAKDKVYSKWGGFLDDVPFDPIRFGIPPKSLPSIEPAQLLTLETVHRALVDAGYENGDFDRENTAVILGGSGGMSDLGQQYATRAELPRMVATIEPQAWERLPEWTEESFPGLLMNVTAGRVANRFDFGGANFTVDAACASSLAALDAAIAQLESGRCNVAIAGGFDTVQSAFSYFCFSKTQALSSQGVARTFDQSADGIVISEGVGAVVLKRLADAQKDGDRIYAVIKAVASSSDGKGLSMTAPASSGQQLAMKRAYAKAGFSPSTIELYEAHGTGTAAGDRTELESINSLLKEHNALPKSCAIGSVKTMIGHTKSTAGIAALVKATLALYHQVLPPHMNVEHPLAELNAEDSPLYLAQEAKPWLRNPAYPRRAGVSAFGFGGTNFHAVIEEYQGNVPSPSLGSETWSCELLVFAADSPLLLSQEISKLRDDLQNGAQPRLQDLAYTTIKNAQEKAEAGVRLSLVVEDLSQLQDSLNIALKHLQGEISSPLPPHIQISTSSAVGAKLAFLFPGQGAQYPDMAREVGLYFPEMRLALEGANQQLSECFEKPLSKFIQPPSAYSEAEEKKAKQQLTETQIAQPAIGAVEAGYLDLVARLSLKPDVVCGHSYGEYAALHTAGVLSREEFLRLSEIRGRVMASACEAADGAMAAVQATREELIARLEGEVEVVIANHNAPQQSVISGKKQAVKRIVERLEVAQIMAKMLPVAGAFHSSLVESAQEALAAAITTAQMELPEIPVYSNTTAHPYASDIESIRNQLTQHLLSSVEFVSQIEAMYGAGTRIFVEIGPKSILTKLVGQILQGKEHTAVALDGQGRGMKGLLIALGTLFTQGVKFNLCDLFSGREVQPLNLAKLLELTQAAPLSSHTWLVNGGSARPAHQAVGHTGKIPALTLEDKQAQETKSPTEAENLNHHQLPNSQPSMSTSNGHHPMSAQFSQSPTPPPPPQAPVSSSEALAAYQAYQETMRQFLSLQERVMEQFLGGGIANPNQQLAENQVYNQKRQDNGNGNGHHRAELLNLEIIHENNQISQSNTTQLNQEQRTNNQQPTNNQEQITNNQQTDRASLTKILLELVSDRTGYPTEMLGLDQDMEADLGIDSIKRVEIFGALQKSLPESLARKLKTQMDSFTQVKTLNSLLDKLSDNKEQITNNQEPRTDRASLRQILLKLVSDRTGYPTEMLGLDQDMEADLGIDSIKRVEIFGALQKSLPEPLARKVKNQMESFTQVKTLNSLLDKLSDNKEPITKNKEQITNNQEPNQEITSLGKPDDAVAIQRYQMQATVTPLNNEENRATASLTGLFLLTEDASNVLAPQVKAALAAQGATPAIISYETLAQREQIELAIAQLRQQYGQVKGIIHLTSYSDVPFPQHLSEWRNLAQTQAKSLFHILQICAEDLRQNQGQVVAISTLGGYFGRNGNFGSGLPLGGSNSGLLKTLALEWEGVRAKAIDFEPSSPVDIATAISQELIATDNQQEIGYFQGRRLVFEPILSTLKGDKIFPLSPHKNWVVLAIGGARGITAEVVQEILVPGMKLILVGRSPEPGEESALTKGIEDISRLRQILLHQAQERGETATPVQIEQRLTKLQRDRNLRHNLAKFKQAGAQVEYHALDATDAVQFGSLINSIYERFGNIDAVIQGAGIIQDKLLVDKTPASFEQVFDTKVDSTFILSRYLRPETLKLMILFTSVAGRTGNRGQCDYAAANEVVNRLAWWMSQQWQNTKVMAINWGPWDVTGMASEQINRQFRERGVIPISPAAGRHFIREELIHGSKDDVELIAGIFISNNSQPQNNASFPLISSKTTIQPNSSVTYDKIITLASDPYLIDHRLDHKPVLPAAGALEYLAEFVQAAWPDWQVAEVRDLRVWRGIVLSSPAGKPVQLQATASTHADSEALQVNAQILDPQTKAPFYRATLLLRPQLEIAPQANLPPLSTYSGLDITSAYEQYCFHGQLFQLLRAIDRFNEQGMQAQVIPSNPRLWLHQQGQNRQNWLFDPGLIDASLQMALIWTHIQGDTGALPAKFGRVVRYGNSPFPEKLRIELRVKEFTPTNMIFDALFIDSDNRIRLQLEDMENTCSKALNRLTLNSADR